MERETEILRGLMRDRELDTLRAEVNRYREAMQTTIDKIMTRANGLDCAGAGSDAEWVEDLAVPLKRALKGGAEK